MEWITILGKLSFELLATWVSGNEEQKEAAAERAKAGCVAMGIARAETAQSHAERTEKTKQALGFDDSDAPK